MDGLAAGRALKGGEAHVDDGAHAGAAVAHLARVRLHVGDELGDGVCRKLWAAQQDRMHAEGPIEIGQLVELVGQVVAHGREYGELGRDEEQRVAIRRRLCDVVDADRGGAAWPVLDDDRLAEPFGQEVGGDPRHDVGAPAGIGCDDDLDGLLLRPLLGRRRTDRGTDEAERKRDGC